MEITNPTNQEVLVRASCFLQERQPSFSKEDCDWYVRQLSLYLNQWTMTDLLIHLNQPAVVGLWEQMESLLIRLSNFEPLQYITKQAEFYGREFEVSPSVLVPRPESEEMINLLLKLVPRDDQPRTLIDIGTGSGCLGITAALELPDNWHVVLSDISPKALLVAEKNAKKLGAKIFTQKQSLLLGQFEKLDCILANLPYVDKSWKNTSPELRHEPSEALYASEGGLKLIRELIQQAPKHMTDQGLLFIEADEEQHQTIIAFGNQNGFLHLETSGLIVVLRLVSTER